MTVEMEDHLEPVMAEGHFESVTVEAVVMPEVVAVAAGHTCTGSMSPHLVQHIGLPSSGKLQRCPCSLHRRKKDSD